MLPCFAGDTVFIHGAAATPTVLVDAMAKYGKEAKLRDVVLCHIHTEGKRPDVQPDCEGESDRKKELEEEGWRVF